MKALQLSLVAVPVLFFAAPSQAGTRLITSSGFTGQFDSGKWSQFTTGSGSNSFTSTTLTQAKPGNSSGQASAQQTVNAAFINSFAIPAYGTFLKAIVTYDYSWDGSTSVFGFNKIEPYTPFAGNSPTTARVKLNTADPIVGVVTQNVFSGDSFGFNVFRNGGEYSATTGTAVISNFKVAAEYEVPGPLPLAGAAAAFAWSRKLRNRLKLSESLG